MVPDTISAWVPPSLLAAYRERLRTFLASLRMGEPKLDDWVEADAAPDHGSQDSTA
jgi:hypothetical protein